MLDPQTTTFQVEQHGDLLIIVGQLGAMQSLTLDARKVAASATPRHAILADARTSLLRLLWAQIYGELIARVQQIDRLARQGGDLAILAVASDILLLVAPSVPALAPGEGEAPDEPTLPAREDARPPREYPTSEEINVLPEPLRRYVHDLETRCDPAGELRERAALKEQVAVLIRQLREIASMLGWKDAQIDAPGFRLFESIQSRIAWLEEQTAREPEDEGCGPTPAPAAATFLAKSLYHAELECSRIETRLGEATEETAYERAKEAHQKLRDLDHHSTGTSIGLADEFGAWFTKDGWEPAKTHPLIGDFGDPDDRHSGGSCT